MEGETALIGSTEQNREVQTCMAISTQPIPHLVCTDETDASLDGENQSMNVEVGSSRVLSSGEQIIALVGGNDVSESSLPNRRSKRLAVKGK
jgi:hypothetical protein